ncbi:MAG: PrsW family glutamic-type intramembrane protease [Candidatus Eremiobacterota bacterium]
MHILLLLAVGPGVALMYYFWLRDRYEREPRDKIVKVMVWGALSVISAVILEMLGENLFPSPNEELPAHFPLLLHCFVVIAGAEELGKFVAVYFTIYRDPEFDEPYDGVVYCVAASLGFAIVENVLYVFKGGIGIGIMRALLSVPAHALFGVGMGYFVGRARFATSKGAEAALLGVGFLTAVGMHGAYDYVLFSGRPLIILTVFPMMVAFWVVGLWLVRRHVAISPFKDRPPGLSSPAEPLPPCPSGQLCPRCAAPSVEGARFCGHCGSSLSPG